MASLMGRAGEQKNQYILIIVSIKIEIAPYAYRINKPHGKGRGEPSDNQ